MLKAQTGLVLVLLGVVILCSGCPYAPAPDYQNALIVSPQELDFGTTASTKTFTVKKVWSSRPIPPFQVSADKGWISVSPTSGTSSGPFDPVTITVTINRSLMGAGINTGVITVAAPGVIPRYVTVNARIPVSVDFRANPTTAYDGDVISFTDLSVEYSTSKAITSWLWEFGDGETSTEQNPTHVYVTPGVYSVRLTVSTGTYTIGRTKENYITINKSAPTAEFSGNPRTVYDGDSVQFTDLSLPGKTPINQWEWNFGDGNTSTQQNPLHVYLLQQASAQYQYFTVSLKVTAQDSKEDTTTKIDYILVRAKPPKADFVGSPTTVDSGGTVQFTDLSDPGSSPITEWEWNFGDGTSGLERFSQNPAHIYHATSQYQQKFTVSLTVRSEHGQNTKTRIDYITVNPASRRGAASLPTDTDNAEMATAFYSIAYPWDSPAKWFLVGEPVFLANQSNVGKLPVSFLWDLGDGTVSTEVSPVHVYLTPSIAAPIVPKLTLLTREASSTYQDTHGMYIFSSTPLDNYLNSSKEGYANELGQLTTVKNDEGELSQWTFISQIWHGEEAGSSDVALRHKIVVAVPQAISSTSGIVVVRPGVCSSVPASEALGVANHLGKIVALVYCAENQPSSTLAGVTTLVRSMDAIQEMLGAKAPSSFALVGEANTGWWTWLAAATDKRVSAVNPVPSGEPPADIDDIAIYFDRLAVLRPASAPQSMEEILTDGQK